MGPALSSLARKSTKHRELADLVMDGQAKNLLIQIAETYDGWLALNKVNAQCHPPLWSGQIDRACGSASHRGASPEASLGRSHPFLRRKSGSLQRGEGYRSRASKRLAHRSFCRLARAHEPDLARRPPDPLIRAAVVPSSRLPPRLPRVRPKRRRARLTKIRYGASQYNYRAIDDEGGADFWRTHDHRSRSTSTTHHSELTKAHDFLFEAHMLVTDVRSLFFNSDDFATAARLKDIQGRLADEVQAVERLIAASKPGLRH